MSEEKDIVERLKERVIYDAQYYPPADPLHAEAASEITRLRGEVAEHAALTAQSNDLVRKIADERDRLREEVEAREVEITALVESAREAQQLYVQADNESLRLRGEVERLTALASREGVSGDLLEVCTFLLGEGPLMHREFGDEPPSLNGRKQPYWWRTKLRAALSSAPKPEEG